MHISQMAIVRRHVLHHQQEDNCKDHIRIWDKNVGESEFFRLKESEKERNQFALSAAKHSGLTKLAAHSQKSQEHYSTKLRYLILREIRITAPTHKVKQYHYFLVQRITGNFKLVNHCFVETGIYTSLAKEQP